MSYSVRYARLPSQGIIYGIDKVGFATLGAVLFMVSWQIITGGLVSLILGLPVTLPLIAAAVIKMYGQSLITHLGRELVGRVRKLLGLNVFKKKLTIKTSPDTVLDVPGMGERLHLFTAPSGACVVWDALKQRATITCAIATVGLGAPTGNIAQTISAEERSWFVWEWAKVLGGFTQKPHIERVSISEQTRPGTVMHEQKQFLEQVESADAAQAASYQQALDSASGAVTMRITQLSVTFKITSEGRELVNHSATPIEGLLALAELEINSISDALAGAGFTKIRWLNSREWASWGKSIIDPVSVGGVDMRIRTNMEGVSPTAVTPTFINDERNYVETDSGFHRAFWVQEWPRYDTEPGFLSRLVFAKQQNGNPVRHTFHLVAAPIPIGKALKHIEEEKRTWVTNSKLRATRQRSDTAADVADWEAINQHEAELIAGQGELRFSAFVLVTATSKDALERESASLLNAITATGLEPRVIPWQQWQTVATIAYPAGLGLK